MLTLCVNGITASWAGTLMALHQLKTAAAANALPSDPSRAARPAIGDTDDCNSIQLDAIGASTPGNGVDNGDHGDCGCGSQALCACTCVLPLFASGTSSVFAAQHLLNSLHPAAQLPPVEYDKIQRLFRPPIG